MSGIDLEPTASPGVAVGSTQSRFLVSLITSSLQPPTADAPLRETTPAQCALYKSIECMLSALQCLTYLKRQAACANPFVPLGLVDA